MSGNGQVAVDVGDEKGQPQAAHSGSPNHGVLEKKMTLADLEEEERMAEGKCVHCVRWWVEDWHFRMNPLHAGIAILLLGVAFIPIGIAIIYESNNIVEVVKRYDDVCGQYETCSISLTIPSTMTAPVYFYYRLVGFPQNQRRYVASVSTDQLRSASYSISDCDPVESNSTGAYYYACGLTASTWFNDVFSLTVNGATLNDSNWTTSGIAWTTDVSKKFVARDLYSYETNVGSRNGSDLTLPKVSDETFMNWMRISAFQTFRKLTRKISDTTLYASDNVTLTVQNQFFITNFESIEKYVVLSTVGWIGGKNTFLGILYCSAGGVLVLVGIAVIVLSKTGKL